MTDTELILYKIKLALDFEIEELQQYQAFMTDNPLRFELMGKIAGLKVAQEYIMRAMLRP